MRQRSEQSIAIAVLLVLVGCLYFGGGCASWQENSAKALNATHLLGVEASKVAEPGYRTKCMAIAAKCKGLPCAELEVCQEERARINSALKALHYAVKVMIPVLPLIDAVRAAGGAE